MFRVSFGKCNEIDGKCNEIDGD